MCEPSRIMRAGDILGGKYVLEQLLGKGGMGVVWAAYDMQMQQKVAVKLILPQNEDALTDELRKRLLREAGACAKLEHPNIIRVYDVGETDEGDAYMVLELLEGQALGDVLKQKRRLEPKLAARIAADVASGLAQAHAAKVVHRDLKPANIYLHREPGMGEDEFVTKVLDFGVCVDRGAMDTLKTQTGIIVGSPAYMSPEQVAMRKDIDGRTDIWSLGLMLYEMVTGTRAFNGTVQNVTAQILTLDVPAPSSKVRDVPPDLDAVVARCTQGKREKRYAEAGELARDLYVIAGVKAPTVRQRSSTTPSVARQLDLVGMLDAEIQASPAVPDAGRARAFNPMGATLPLIPRERRLETEVLPPVMDEEDDLVATRPFQPHMLAAVRSPVASKAQEESQEGAQGTQFLRVDQPIASPEPEWKREMAQALEAHRQSSTSLPVFEANVEVAKEAGGTQMLSADMVKVRPDAPLRSDATGTTSMAGTMSQEVRSPVKTVPDLAGMTGRRRRQTRRLMFVAGGILASAFAFMVVVVVLKGGEPTPPQDPAGSRVDVPLPPEPIATENAPATAEPVKQNAPAASASANAPPPAASAAAAPTVTAAVPSAVTNAPVSTTPVATTKSPGTSAPVKTSVPTKKTKTVEAPKNCTGFGVFRRCN